MKWSGVAGVIPAGTERLTLEKASKKVKTTNKQPKASISITETPENIQVETGVLSVYIPRHGEFLIDSLLYKGTKVGRKRVLSVVLKADQFLKIPPGSPFFIMQEK